VTPQEEIIVLRNAIKRMREQRDGARALIEILMRELAETKRAQATAERKITELERDVAEGVGTD